MASLCSHAEGLDMQCVTLASMQPSQRCAEALTMPPAHLRNLEISAFLQHFSSTMSPPTLQPMPAEIARPSYLLPLRVEDPLVDLVQKPSCPLLVPHHTHIGDHVVYYLHWYK